VEAGVEEAVVATTVAAAPPKEAGAEEAAVATTEADAPPKEAGVEAPLAAAEQDPAPASEQRAAAAVAETPAAEERSPAPAAQAKPKARPAPEPAQDNPPQPRPGTKIVEVSKKLPERSNTEPSWRLQHFNKPLPKMPAAAGGEPAVPWKTTLNRRHTLGGLKEEESPKPKEVREPKKLKAELKEFWGKNAKGFAGPSIGSTSRLSKCEAQATLQRLIAAGSAVDYDEVRRLRKMIAELD